MERRSLRVDCVFQLDFLQVSDHRVQEGQFVGSVKLCGKLRAAVRQLIPLIDGIADRIVHVED